MPAELTLNALSFRAGDPMESAPLPMRVDAFQVVPVPEWERGRNTEPADSPVLYMGLIEIVVTLTWFSHLVTASNR